MILGAAGLLALLHMLKVRPDEVRAVTTLFWIQAARESRTTTLLERFRHPFTYALLLLICCLILLALGRPESGSFFADRVHGVIILDCTPSMAAKDEDGKSRMNRAGEAAAAEAKRLSPDDRLCLLVADPIPRVDHRFEDPPAFLRKRLAAARPCLGPADLSAALRLASSLLEDKTNPFILLVTDRKIEEDLLNLVDPSVDLRVRIVGAPAANAALLSAQFHYGEEDPALGVLHVRAGYWGNEKEEVRISIHREDEGLLAEQKALLAPATTHTFVFEGIPADIEKLALRIDPMDAVPSDNSAAFTLPRRRMIGVKVEGELPPHLQVLLESDPWIRIVNEGEDFPHALSLDPERLASDEEKFDPESAVSLIRGIRSEAGWSGGTVTFPGHRKYSDCRGEGEAMGASPLPEENKGRSSMRSPFEILLFLAFLLFLAEAFLHARGRIS